MTALVHQKGDSIAVFKSFRDDRHIDVDVAVEGHLRFRKRADRKNLMPVFIELKAHRSARGGERK